MKLCLYVIFVVGTCLLSSCEKNEYNSLNGNITLAGHAYIADTLNGLPVGPLVGQKIYLNTGSDTSTYIFQTNTDSTGMFLIPSLSNNKKYIVFSKFIRNSIEFSGAQAINGGAVNETIRISFNVYPSYFNGMSILFTDSLGGLIPNLPFRIYNSRVAAAFDSVQYAFANTKSDINGLYNIFNVNPIKYYVVSSTIIGPATLKIFDSITVPADTIKRSTMVLK